MSDSTYDFPEPSDVPTIEYDGDPYEQPETKNLFIKYDPDEWENPEDARDAIQTINYLFGTDAQVVVMDEKLAFLDESEVRDLLEDLIDDDE